MYEIVRLAPFFLLGVVLGTMFFVSLWMTIRKSISSKRSSLWFIGSMVLRMSITMTAFYLVVRGQHWQRLLVCIAGFVIARLLVTRLIQVMAKPNHPIPEGARAP